LNLNKTDYEFLFIIEEYVEGDTNKPFTITEISIYMNCRLNNIYYSVSKLKKYGFITIVNKTISKNKYQYKITDDVEKLLSINYVQNVVYN
jgi:predicted transcriptional regulator